MSQRKYIVIQTREARTELPPEWVQALENVVRMLNDARQAKQPPKPLAHYFPLNMNDKYALAAVEAYINAIDADDANNHNDGVKAARQAALEARDFAIMKTTGEKLPS